MPDRMPRIDDRLLQCVFYLYNTEDNAKKGASIGGCGFFIGVPTGIQPGHFWLVAIANKHTVCDSGASVIRVNTVNGGTEVFQIEPHEWIQHPDGDDLVAFPFPYERSHKVMCVEENKLLDMATIHYRNIGPGDDIFMIGRFINHDGVQTNMPSVRFGNISMNPTIVKHPQYGCQESYAIELRSMCGYSGSPVFIARVEQESREEKWSKFKPYTWLVGVNWGHVTDDWLVNSTCVDKRKEFVKANTGMNFVIPSSRLARMLHIPPLQAYYDKMRTDYIRIYGNQSDQTVSQPKAIENDTGP